MAYSPYYLRDDTFWDEKRFVDSIHHAYHYTDIVPASRFRKITQKHFDEVRNR